MLASKIEKRFHCVKSVRVRSFSGPYFLAFGLNTEIYSARMGGGNTDQNNSEYVRSLVTNKIEHFPQLFAVFPRPPLQK